MSEQTEHIRIAHLIVRRIADGSRMSEKEKQEFEDWLSFSEANRSLWLQLSGGKTYADFDEVCRLTDGEEHWKYLEAAVRSRLRKKLMLYWCSRAAAVILLFTFGYYYFFSVPMGKTEVTEPILPAIRQAVLVLNDGRQIPLIRQDTLVNTEVLDIEITSGQARYCPDRQQTGDTTPVFNTIIVPRGGIYSLILSDGSTVFLNSESELTYPVKFCGNRREVELKGEALFEVAHKPEQPFVVTSGVLETKVLGTVFNVMAYQDESEIQTTLITGEGEVAGRDTKWRDVLHSGGQACWRPRTGEWEIRQVDIRLKSLWKDGIIVLNDNSLEEVMRMLSRWYDVEYIFDTMLEGTHTFTGRINRNTDLESVLKKLTLLGGPDFRVEGRVIHISDRKK